MDPTREPQTTPYVVGVRNAELDEGVDNDETRSTKNRMIDQTLATWQKRTNRELTREDAREIAENVLGFFHVLQEWEAAERAVEQLASQEARK